MNLSKIFRRWVQFFFCACCLLVVAFSVPFLKPLPFAWTEMNGELRAVIFFLAAAFLLHAVLTLSTANALRLFGIAFLFSYAAEYVGLRWSGFLGNLYRYSPALSPTLPGGVPIIVVLMWFILAYTALKFLQPVAAEQGNSRPLTRILFKGGLCALHITATDLFIDPLGTHGGLWSWQEQGGYYGTPWGNFGAWFLVGLIISCLYLSAEKPLSPDRRTTDDPWDMIFIAVAVSLTFVCFAACYIHLDSVVPVALSLIVLGPFWVFRAVYHRRVQPVMSPRPSSVT